MKCHENCPIKGTVTGKTETTEMLVKRAEREVQTGGGRDIAEYRIKNSAKAFRILIDGLYSNKILAVVRELCTNAFDSHTAAGVPDVPFDVHLPTVHEPHFTVRDYGTSMSHETVMGLYSTLFASSKDMSNEQVGKLGLGSKSPFAYRDAFTLSCWLNGRQRSYSVFLNSEHVPTIQLIADRVSNERRGVEVSVPVALMDIYKFTAAARDVANGFTGMQPTWNDKTITTDNRVLMSGDGWTLFEKPLISTRPTKTAVLRQGCVAYPINYSSLYNNFPYSLRSLTDNNLLIDFPIGALEVTASREDLSYDKETIENIVKRLEQVKSEVLYAVNHKIKNAKTFWEAFAIIDDIRKYNGNLYDCLNMPMMWRGKDLSREIELSVEGLQVASYDRKSVKSRGFRWPNHLARYNEYTRSAKIEECTQLYVEDVTLNMKGAQSRIRLDVLAKPHLKGSFFWVKCDPKSYAFKRFLAKTKAPKEAIVFVADVIPVKRVYPPRNKSTVFKIAGIKISNNGEHTDSDVIVGQPGVYFVTHKRNIVVPSPVDPKAQLISPRAEVKQAISYLRDNSLVPPNEDIFAIPLASETRLKKAGWKHAYTLIENHVKANFDVEAYKTQRDHVSSFSAKDAYVLEKINRFYEQCVKQTPKDPNSLFGEVIKLVLETTAKQTDWIKKREFLLSMSSLQLPRKLNIDVDTIISAKSHPLLDKFKEKYPLIGLLMDHGVGGHLYTKSGMDYIDMIDRLP